MKRLHPQGGTSKNREEPCLVLMASTEGSIQLPKHRYLLLWGTQAIHGELVGTLQDLEQLLESGWPLWGNSVALESYFSNKSSPSLPTTDPLLPGIIQGTALLRGEAGGQIQVEGRGAWLADSPFLTLLSAILCSLLFSEVFGPASSCGMKRLSQHVRFLTGGVWL